MARKSRSTMAAKQDLLIEIGCEDLPARYVKTLADALASGISDGLRSRGVAYQQPVRSFATPRRLAVLIANVAALQDDRPIERKGPKLAAALKNGEPTPAGLGFAKSCAVAFSALAQENDQLVFRSVQKGRPTAALLPEIFEETLKSMDEIVPKRMRWGSSDETFVRPVQWIVALLGSKVVPISRFGLQSGNKTYGHRFHAPKPIVLKSPREYEKKLEGARVWADFASRRAEIWKKIEAEARKLKGSVRPNDALLDEVTALVEWPVAIHGRMEQQFMQLPPEVVVATIEHNQRYFPVYGPDKQLRSAFITISNIESRDTTQVVTGNERVVRPRLADALFFWEQDQKKALPEYLEALGKVTFQQKLGSVEDKTKRIVAISSKIAELSGIEVLAACRAAELCKADLVTRMVYEFPELQGVMGGYYARSSGETQEVAAAIREHYLPTQSGGPIPASAAGRVVALADKLDTLAGIFAIGQKPSSSKDPYALRRAALGVLRILIEGELDLDLRELLIISVALQPGVKNAESLAGELLQFHWDRLHSYYVESGIAIELFESAQATGVTKPLDLHCRLRAVESFVQMPESARLASAHKRVRNILRQARERNEAPSPSIDRALAESAELKLIEAMGRLNDAYPLLRFKGGESAVSSAEWKIKTYTNVLKGLAGLQGPVDQFFNDVMVMAEDPAVRANRLALLGELDALCRSVADISCLPG